MVSVKYLNLSGPRLPDISNEEAKPDPRYLCDPNFCLVARTTPSEALSLLKGSGDGKVTGL